MQRMSTGEVDDYEFLEVSSITSSVRNFETRAKTEVESQSEKLNMWKPLNASDFLSYFDSDGRLINESTFCERVFSGGCYPDIRPDVWRFLFDMYPIQSTTTERNHLKIALYYKYEALKAVAKLHTSNAQIATKTCQSITTKTVMDLELPTLQDGVYDEEKLLAKLYAAGQPYDTSIMQSWMTVLEKDIPRTDKDNPYFCKDENINKLRNILTTYAFFHPKVGYVQGMNDILTRFLIVLDDEMDSYWCFTAHMDKVENDFKADSMMEKIKHVECLLDELEPDLYRHLSNCQMQDVIFCHRWLLLSFKREFTLEDSIKYFEMISSRHFGLDTMVAVAVRDEQFTKELLASQGEVSNTTEIEDCFSVLKSWYSIDIFVCVAVISLYKEEFLACTDSAEVSHVACHLMGMLNLFKVLEKSKEMLVRYCRKCVRDEFNKKQSPLMEFRNGIRTTLSKFMASLTM